MIMIEDVIRATLSDDRHRVGAWSDPVHRIEEGINTRRQRRRLVAMLAMVFVVGVTPFVVVSQFGREQGSDVVIPHLNRPVLTPPVLLRGSPRPEAIPCLATELGVDTAWTKANKPYLGRQATTVLVANLRHERCTLSAPASLTAVNTITGETETFTANGLRFDDSGGKQYPATLTAGEPARIDLVTQVGCEPIYRDPVLTVLGAQIPVPLERVCRPELSDWYREAPLENAPLTVTMTAPATVQRGQYIDYTVTVLSPFPHGFPLVECPVYLEQLGDITAWLHMNCDRLTRFPPHVPITFAMRVYVPQSHPLGEVRLRWMAVVHGGEVAIANLATDGTLVRVVE